MFEIKIIIIIIIIIIRIWHLRDYNLSVFGGNAVPLGRDSEEGSCVPFRRAKIYKDNVKLSDRGLLNPLRSKAMIVSQNSIRALAHFHKNSTT